MIRYRVDDKARTKIEPLLPTRGGRQDNQLFFNAVYYIAKSGSPGRDLQMRCWQITAMTLTGLWMNSEKRRK